MALRPFEKTETAEENTGDALRAGKKKLQQKEAATENWRKSFLHFKMNDTIKSKYDGTEMDFLCD